MRTVLFLSRVAVLMNVMFLLFLAGYFNLMPVSNSYLNGLVVTTGWVFAFLLNLVLHPFLLIRTLLKREVTLPGWMLVFNLVCFIIQIIFYFFT
ncbi:MAG TPA: hypothetical protein VF145_12690 [Chitinophagaceae bacterium]